MATSPPAGLLALLALTGATAACSTPARDPGRVDHPAVRAAAGSLDPPAEDEAAASGPEDPGDTGPLAGGDTAPADPTDTAPSGPPGATAGPPAGLGAGFEDLTAPAWSTGDFVVDPGGGVGSRHFPSASWLTAGDLDGDGVSEVVVAEVQQASQGPDAPRVQVLSWDPAGAGLVWHAGLTAALTEQPGVVVAVLDLDGDGHADLLRASDRATFGFGDGRGVFDPVALGLPGGVARVPGLHVAALVDLDKDGWLDVLFGPGDCSSSLGLLPALRTGVRSWEARTDLVEQPRVGIPYALAVYPRVDGGQDLVALGRGCSYMDGPTDFYASGARRADGRVPYAPVERVPPDAWFRQRPEGVGAPLSRRNPMGGAVTDLDRDGLLDLVVAPADGLVFTFLGAGASSFHDATGTFSLEVGSGAAGGPLLPWGVGAVDLDLDGRTDLVVAFGDDARVNDPGDWDGPYRPRAWWTAPEGPSVELTELTGLAPPGNWRGLVVLDVDGDATPDLGLGGLGMPPRLLRNVVQTDHHRVAVRLRGTTSNHLGVGAVVVVEAAGVEPQTFAVGAGGSPGGLSAPVVFAGLGDATRVERLTVRWPSGTVQVVQGLAADQTHTLVEPPVLTLSEPSRHLPADGVAELTVRVEPRDERGDPRQAATVHVGLLAGHAEFVGPAVRDGWAWERVLRAPAVAGEVVLRVEIDGEELPLAPRVWFDHAAGPDGP